MEEPLGKTTGGAVWDMYAKVRSDKQASEVKSWAKMLEAYLVIW